MNRNSFLKVVLAMGSLFTAPATALAIVVKKLRSDKGVIVKAGKDRFNKPISLLEGDTFFTKVSMKDTGGSIYVFESTRLKEGGPSFHVHFEQDEYWYVLKGKFLFKVGDETFEAKEGDSVFGPRNVPHAFAKIGKGEARLLMFFQPAGKMEEFFQKLSAGVAKNMTEDEQDKFRIEHGFKKVGPPLMNFKKW